MAPTLVADDVSRNSDLAQRANIQTKTLKFLIHITSNYRQIFQL